MEKKEWPGREREGVKRLILKSLHFLPFYFFIAPLGILCQTCPLNAERLLTVVISWREMKKIRLRTEMEIESFHVGTIKMFVVELQVVEMRTHRPSGNQSNWRLDKKSLSNCENILKMPSSEVMSVIN